MRRSSGSRATAVAPVAAAVLLAVISSPVAAGEPNRIVIGGGDDPAIVVEQSADELAVTRWKMEQAAVLRAAVEGASKRRAGGSGGGPQPALAPPPCTNDCAPTTFALNSYARQQINWYYCGPASAQVIINQTRDVVSSSTGGQATTTNYRTQSVIGAFMGTTDASGSSSWMVRSGLNQYADLDDSGIYVPFSVIEGISSGSDFHWAMVHATWILHRGAAVPVQMTFSSQHLASWASSSWWNSHSSAVVRHWLSVRGYAGFWDGTYGPSLYYTDSAGGYGGQTGNFTSASRLLYNLNQANSGRIVY